MIHKVNVLIAVAFTVAAVLLVAASCGRRSAPTDLAGVASNANRMTVPSSVPDGQEPENPKPVIHRPRTWQDIRDFIPYEDYRPDQLLVRFADELGVDERGSGTGIQPGFNSGSVLYQNVEHAEYARELANRYGLAVLENQEAYVQGFNFCGYQLPAGADAEELMQRVLDENPATVRFVEYNAIRRACYTPDDPYLGDQWHHNTIDSYEAWDSYGDPDPVIIAVLDTGIDTDHEDLWWNTLDWWDTYDLDLVNPDWKPEDDHGHGTHVAGIAASVGDNLTGVAGIAYQAWILPIKVLPQDEGTLDATEQGIILATQLGADVINLSLGGYFPSLTEKEACEYAYVNDVIVVAAAGNDKNTAQICYPAGIPTVMAVGATDDLDYRADLSGWGSNYGWWVDIAAPGVDIYSTVIGGYDYNSGTSMASPIVAGAAALIKSISSGYEIDEYRGWLESGGDALANQSEWENDWIGRLNVNGALWYPENQLPIVEITAPENGAPVSGVTAIELSITDDADIMGILLYIDGIWWDGGKESYEVDFTDFYPGECNIIAEVIDEDHQHAFDEITVIITDPSPEDAPYYTSFDLLSDTDGWLQFSHSGENVWNWVNDEKLLRLDYAANDVDWLLTPNIDLGDNTEAKIVLKAGSDYFPPFPSSSDVFLWLYPDKPEFEYNCIPLSWFEPVEGFSGYYELLVSFEPGEPFKAAFMLGWPQNGPYNGSYITIDEFYLTVPTDPPSVNITQPVESEHVSDTVDFWVNATDDWEVIETQFYADDKFLAADYAAPYRTTLDTHYYANGSLELEVIAFDWDWYDYDGDGNPWDYGTDSHSVVVENQQITSLDPTSGYYTDMIDIHGEDFAHHRAGAELSVFLTGSSGWLLAQVEYWTDTTIQVVVPIGIVTGPVRVYIDESYAESSQNFVIDSPFATFHFIAPDENVMFTEDFSFHIPAQPDLDEVEVTIDGYPSKAQVFYTLGVEVAGTMDISGLNTGVYSLQATGHYGNYSDTIERRFFILALPGDFNGNGVIDDGDATYLRDHINAHGGEIGSDHDDFYPFLDVTQDGIINEQDLAYVGYYYGDKPE